MTMRARKTAVLTPQEDKAWVDEFSYAKEQGKDDVQADAQAFRQVRKQFPRLRKYSRLAP
jgi:DNA repair ATPase RecN